MMTINAAASVCLVLAATVAFSSNQMESAGTQPTKSLSVANAGNVRRSAQRAAAPDQAVYNIVLKPPLVHGSAEENCVFVANGMVQPGAQETKSFILPKLERIKVLLLGERVTHAFRSPSGQTIVPGKTPDRPGYEYFGTETGIAGFTLDHPQGGAWTVTFEAAPEDSAQRYAIVVESEGPVSESAHLETLMRESDPNASFLATPGQPVFVRTFVTHDGHPIPGVRWNVHAFAYRGPEEHGQSNPQDSAITIPVYDDGLHADGRVQDGVSVGAIVAEGLDGFYQVRAEGRTPRGVQYVVTGTIEVQAKNDLLIADTITVSPLNPRVGEPVTLTVTAMNDGTVDSKGVELELLIDRREVSSQKFNLAAGESRRLATTWTPSAPGTYEVQLSINPFLEPYASDFENNTQRAVVTVR